MLDEPFASGTSTVHGLDPRVKIAAATACAVVIGPATGAGAFGAACAALIAGAGLCAWARLPLGPLLRRLVSINLFAAFLWLFLPFTTPGSAALHLGPLTATDAGIAQALLITLKTNAVMLWFVALVATSDAAAIGQALGRLGVHPKLVFLFLFTYRFAHVLGAELERLTTAAKLRGFAPRSGLHTWRTLASLLAMVLIGAMRRAEMSRQAMQLRGFHGKFATLRAFRAGPQSRAFLAASTLFLAALAWWEIVHV